MKLAANITIGWADISNSPFCAWKLHSQAVVASDYRRSLLYQLQLIEPSTRISGLDYLFRRTYGGFDPVLQFVNVLTNLPEISNAPAPLLCDVDLFAYAFLAGTHNFGRLLPLVQGNSVTLAQMLNDCQEAMRTLETFERTGAFLPAQMSEIDTHRYLSIRQVVAQPSACKELQVLAALLISGPSTASNLASELALTQKETNQTLHLFRSIGILSCRNQAFNDALGSDSSELVFSISKVVIPLVLFCLKERLGLDLIGDLLALMDANYA